jgi:hypothetical protein
MQTESTAYHESGHAVASYLLGRGIRHVTVIESDDEFGHVANHSRGPRWIEALEDAEYEASYGRFINARTRRAVEIEIMISYAGGLTEAAFTGGQLEDVAAGMGMVPYTVEQREQLMSLMDDVPEDLVHLDGDYEKVSFLAEMVSGSQEEANAYLGWLEQRTRNLIFHPWFKPAVRALAAALVERKTLSGRDARAIIDAAIEADFSG